MACAHGTFVLGILAADRGSGAPGICPNCSFLIRPVFLESARNDRVTPGASPGELATAITECVTAGVRIINLSLALGRPSVNGNKALSEALDHATRRGALLVAAAGNQGTVGTTPLTRHPGVIPVVACDTNGQPLPSSNLGQAIARQGLRAPGGDIPSLGTNGPVVRLSGTSAATPFVTGAAALLWSLFPQASPTSIRLALQGTARSARTSIVPPLLDAGAAHRLLAR